MRRRRVRMEGRRNLPSVVVVLSFEWDLTTSFTFSIIPAMMSVVVRVDDVVECTACCCF